MSAEQKTVNTASPPPPNSVALPPGIQPLSLTLNPVADLPVKLREAADRVSNHCFNKSGDSALMSIPANPTYDVDLLLIHAAERQEHLTETNARLSAENTALREALNGIEVVEYGNPEECWFLLRSDGKEIGAGSVRLTGEFAVAFSKWAAKRRSALASESRGGGKENNT